MASEVAWQKCRLPVSADALRKYDVVEVLRLALSMGRSAKRREMSEETKRARDALADSPHNMCRINELGRIYADEAQYDKCEIALLRGWKRASEIDDTSIRFCFLMKLCEVSYYLRKYRQAAAVLKDVEEPQAPEELQPFLLLACRVHACNNDVTGAMRFFSRAIEKEDFQSATKILALVMFDMRKCGAYEPAKHAVESLATNNDPNQMLQMLDDACEQKPNPRVRDEQNMKYLMVGTCAVAGLIMCYLMYWLEQHSLSRWATSGRHISGSGHGGEL